MKALVQCPNGHRFRCDPAHLGRRTKCPAPGCGAPFTLEAREAERDDGIYALEQPETATVQLHATPPLAIDAVATESPSELCQNRPMLRELFRSDPIARRELVRQGTNLPRPKEISSAVIFLLCAVTLVLLGVADLFSFLRPVISWICYLLAAFFALGSLTYFIGHERIKRLETTKPISGNEAALVGEKSLDSEPRRQTVITQDASRAVLTPEQRTLQLIHQEVDRQNSAKSSWMRGINILGVSLLLFVALGLFRFDLTFVGLLILTLLLHESGHLLAMLGFGYSNVQMFFIPLFGAAVSGRKNIKSGWQEALISLAGPLPSLSLGYVLLFIGFSASLPALILFAGVLIVLNGFNLLPIFPLDGGRVLNETIFVRSRVAEVAFRSITAGSIVLIAIVSRDIYFGIFGGLMLISIRRLYTIGGVVNDLRARLPSGMYGDFNNQPVTVRDEVIRTVRKAMPDQASATVTAREVRDVWQRLNTRPPGAAATVGLLALYTTSFLSVFVVPLFVLILMVSGSLEAPKSGPIAEFISGLRVGFYAGVQGGERVHGAVLAQDHDALRRTIEQGDNINALDQLGQTPLLLASSIGDAGAISLLLNAGANPNIANDLDVAPLHEAVISGCEPCVEHLLNANASIDLQDHRGHTPLHYAVQEDYPTLVSMLLDAGADPTIKCMEGDGDALDHAYLDPPLINEEVIVQYLEEAMRRRGAAPLS